jgi:hypothetical protein
MLFPFVLVLSLPRAPSVLDLNFMERVEAFVRSTEPSAQPPEPFRTDIARMGHRYWKCRLKAQQRLHAASLADQRWLFWARASRDREIGMRANAILRAINRCVRCNGEGKYTKKSEFGDWMVEVNCPDCFEWGTWWPWTPWD